MIYFMVTAGTRRARINSGQTISRAQALGSHGGDGWFFHEEAKGRTDRAGRLGDVVVLSATIRRRKVSDETSRS